MICIYCKENNSRGSLRCLKCGRVQLTEKDRQMGVRNVDVDDMEENEVNYLDSWLAVEDERVEKMRLFVERLRGVFLSFRVILAGLVALLCVGIAVVFTFFMDWVI